jgi:hypothetical protein
MIARSASRGDGSGQRSASGRPQPQPQTRRDRIVPERAALRGDKAEVMAQLVRGKQP